MGQEPALRAGWKLGMATTIPMWPRLRVASAWEGPAAGQKMERMDQERGTGPRNEL